MNKLSIGCGNIWRELGPEWDGLDIFDFGQRHVWDMEKTPWPSESEVYDELRAWHVLEHMHQEKVIAVMNEANRILKPRGIFDIKVPPVQSLSEAFSDPTHLSTWTVTTFKNYFCGKSPRTADYGIKKWQTNFLDDSDPGVIHIILQK